MSHRLEIRRKQLLKKIICFVEKNAPQHKKKLLTEFAIRYFSTVAFDDLSKYSLPDLQAILLSHWQFINNRAPNEIRIRIFNPDQDKDGWTSNHTIIQISHDNMPFLVDSIQMAIQRKKRSIHLMIYTGGFDVIRNQKNHITTILPPENDLEDTPSEAPIYVEIEKIDHASIVADLEKTLQKTLSDNMSVVLDWRKMHSTMRDAVVNLENNPPPLNKAEIAESECFLKWLLNRNFIFLGCRHYQLIKQRGKPIYRAIPRTGLGLLKSCQHECFKELATLPPLVQKKSKNNALLLFTKTNTRSPVHRNAYLDYVSIRQFDQNGNMNGEIRFIGLYASIVYNSNPKNIPFVRQKIKMALEKSQLNLLGHAGKALRYTIDNLPRDDLFQASSEEILALGRGILQMQERQQIRLFLRRDIYGRYYSCLVYLPRDRFSTSLRKRLESLLKKELRGNDITFDVKLFESQLARIQYWVRINPNDEKMIDEEALEKKIILASRSWLDECRDLLIEKHGERKGLSLFLHYQHTFPAGYREDNRPEVAVNHDLLHLTSLSEGRNDLCIDFYERDQVLHFRLFRCNHIIQLSDVLPMLENLGLRVLEECPHELRLPNGTSIWLNDFEVLAEKKQTLDADNIKNELISAFKAVWHHHAESDRFNVLVILAGLSWRMVAVFRAYAKYFKQIGFPFSPPYIAKTLIQYPHLTTLLSSLFEERFDPEKKERSLKPIQQKIETALDNVASLDEDRIIRRYVEIILATTRTNFYQQHHYFSFKLNPLLISDLPKPILTYEIFVYASRFEGVHLRGAKVARGGLRWSDRREDFRTEILGLVKAQQVKNAVIVPLGAKGGFVPKCLPQNASRDEVISEAIWCYKKFIRGLLDITDNLKQGAIIPPKCVVRYDEDDPYLVVAADKGTATFSDIANHIAAEYDFWLGDAFASGGSAGYDHKKMGITARGTWESVKRHFKEAAIDIEKPFTVIGIGDMSGDVFGNGLLLSEKIKLFAAFNHQHIFIDPNPIVEKSFKERQRLFRLPRSSWADYDVQKISSGGGVFSRYEKFIRLSPEIKKLLNLQKEKVIPSELIRAILKTKVDLLWNGGIGTYVKATDENHIDVGDRANDHVRIDAIDLGCRVVGEGGNLGLTPLARVEYDLNGGRCYTDFIDNSAGVNCSDHEVNIKILLDTVMAKNQLTRKERNKLLLKMTPQVAQLVLRDNFRQTRALSMAYKNAANNVDLYERLINRLEEKQKLDRAIEYLPDHDTLLTRKINHQGLTRSELSILLAYRKIGLKNEILKSDLPEDPCFSPLMFYEFPNTLHKTYYIEMQSHSLRREIIATQLSNSVINEMGLTFIYRIHEETGALIPNIIKAFAVARKVFDRDRLWRAIETTKKIDIHLQYDLLRRLNQLIRRATRWFLYNFHHIDIDAVTAQFQPLVAVLSKSLWGYLPKEKRLMVGGETTDLMKQGVNKSLAFSVATFSTLLSALDLVQAVTDSSFSIRDIAMTYFSLDDLLNLEKLRKHIIAYPVSTKWDALARVAFRDDLDRLQREMTLNILQSESKRKALPSRILHWSKKHKDKLNRWQQLSDEMNSTDKVNVVMLSVILRELSNFK